MRSNPLRFVTLFAALAAVIFAPSAHAQSASRVYFNQDIFIALGQQVANATCLFCSIQVEGDLAGRAIVIGGNVNVSGRVNGPVWIFFGNAVIDSQARIGGNAVVVGGNAVYETDDSIAGNAWVIGGHLSPLGGRHRPINAHRVSFSPLFFISLGITCLILLSAIFFPRRKTDPA